MGKTEIKTAPKRVVVLDVGEFDNVVSLGLKPVGYAPSEGDAAIPSYLKKDAGEPKSVGTINSLNLEAIAGLQPDLILGSQLRAADQVRRAVQDRPTVFSIRPGFTWKENYLLNAQALDRTKQAEANLDAYEAKSRRARRGHRPRQADRVHGPLHARPPPALRQGLVHRHDPQDVGLPRPKNQQIDDLAAEISPEKIDEADADWIFTGVYGDPKATQRDTARSNPLWKNLKAVKEGRAKDVSDETCVPGPRRHLGRSGPRRPPRGPGEVTARPTRRRPVK